MFVLLISLCMAGDDKKTTIDFEAVDIEGQIRKPPGALVQDNRRALFNPLVRIRSEWTLEITGSVKDID